MKRLLPPGSVVKLKQDADQKVMIVSRLAKKQPADPVSEYCGCTVPVGFRDAGELVFFNTEDVARLVFVGLQDEEEIAYSFEASKYAEAHAEQFKKGEE